MDGSTSDLTLIIGQSDVARLLPLPECMAAIEDAFRREAAGRTLGPAVLGLKTAGGGFHIKAAAMLGDRGYFAAKVNGNFPDNPGALGLPAIQGVVVLCDAADGRVLAIIDSIELTARRTAATSAVAAKYLARPGSRIATICGCGRQGRAHLEALAALFALTTVFAVDRHRATAEKFAAALGPALGLDIRPTDDLGAAARASDICVTCTPSRSPLLGAADVAPGLFVAAVGADNPQKHEIAPDLLAAATVVADVIDQCAEMGDLHHALAAGVMRREDVHAELGEVVTGRKPGRRSPDDVVVFDSTGTALQDVAAAAHVYARACGLGAGRPFGFAD
jgi:alanine dehydrogenase